MGELSLSIFFGYHDSSVTVADGENVLLHFEAERYFRRKHCLVSPAEMEELVAAALAYVGHDIAAVGRLYVAHMKNPYPAEVELCGRRFRPIITYHHQNHIGTVLDHGFGPALIVVADGGSEDGSTRVYLHAPDGTCTQIDDLDETPANGKFYGSLTMLVIDPDFFKAHGWYSGKTMGLAAFGRYREDYASLLATNTPQLLWGNVLDLPAMRGRFGLGADYSKPWLDEARRDLACTGQQFWQTAFRDGLARHRHLSGNVVLVGGCALNVLLNSELIDSGLFERVHVGPVSGDGGQSLGAILFHERGVRARWPFLGRGFGDVDALPSGLVGDLLAGKLVAWYQGRAEVGPRALGHRSVLGLPNTVSQRDRMNRVKGREPYRPVAPMVPEESLVDFFDTRQPSPYMSFGPRAREVTCRLAPAIVHADGTARVQTLRLQDNPVLHAALTEIGQATGAPIIMNTSFNVAGEAMVDTPDDARRSFRKSGFDILYINGERETR